MPRKWKCKECMAVTEKLLEASNPFNDNETVYGCPNCRCCGGPFYRVCDVPECKEKVVRGWISPDGYRTTCEEHYKDYGPLT